MTKQFNGLVCVGCGGNLELEVGFTGADWDCEAGKGSGFDHEVRLTCNAQGCGRTYHIGNVKNERHFSPSLKGVPSEKCGFTTLRIYKILCNIVVDAAITKTRSNRCKHRLC